MTNLKAPSKWFYFGIVSVILGFIFLRVPPVDGFLTMNLAPIFLVAGFLVFIPMGLWPKIRDNHNSEYIIKVIAERVYVNTFGLVVFATVWFIYIHTLWPGPGWWGSGEYINGAYNLIVQSPPGSVILQITGRLFSFLWFIENPAVRINFMIATVSASAVTVLYFTIIRLLKLLVSENRKKVLLIVPAVIASITFAFTESVWNKATFTNPYALSLLTASMMIYIAVRWWESADEHGSGNFLLLAAFLFGLDLSVHRSNLLFIPAFFFMVLIRKPKTFLDMRVWIGGIVLLFFGFSLQLFNMFRAQLDPLINFNNQGSWQGLWDYLSLKQYDIKTFGSDLLQRKGPFWETQVKHEYLRYLGWNFIGMDNQGENVKWTGMYGLPLIIGMIGFVCSFVKRFKTAIFILGMFLAASLGAIIYLNVPENFFRPMDRHYLPSFMLIAVWIAVGCYVIQALISRLFKDNQTAFYAITIILFLTLPLNMLKANWTNNDQSKNYSTYNYGYNLLQSCDENAILVNAGDNDTFICWYLQQVEKIRPDVITINYWLMSTPWYPESIKLHYPNTPFDIAYDSSVNNAMPWEGDTVIIAGDSDTLSYFLEPTFNNKYLLPHDQRFLEVLKKNRWERQICFSSGFGNRAPLNLSDFTQMYGLVFNLNTRKSDSLEIDYGKLEKILFDKFTYSGYGESKSLDRVGVNMKNNYLRPFMELAIHYKTNEENEKLDLLMRKFEQYFPDNAENFRGFIEGNEGENKIHK